MRESFCDTRWDYQGPVRRRINESDSNAPPRRFNPGGSVPYLPHLDPHKSGTRELNRHNNKKNELKRCLFGLVLKDMDTGEDAHAPTK